MERSHGYHCYEVRGPLFKKKRILDKSRMMVLLASAKAPTQSRQVSDFVRYGPIQGAVIDEKLPQLVQSSNVCRNGRSEQVGSKIKVDYDDRQTR